jgi:Arc/MetJ family transcription regulator
MDAQSGLAAMKKMLASMACMPYRGAMKMTMHIKEDILDEVVRITGVESKTKAVETALSEMVRRNRLKTKLAKGLGLSSAELKNAWEDPFPEETAKAAEKAPKHGRKGAHR